jgi:CheY-like chemotaxis protein
MDNRRKAIQSPHSKGRTRGESRQTRTTAAQPRARSQDRLTWTRLAHSPEREPLPFDRDGVAQRAGRDRDAPLVLIVEDEKSIAEALELIFEEAGCRVAIAPNGAVGLALARKEQAALILTDLMMPVMSGRELIAALRDEVARGAIAPAPVVVMTAMGHVHMHDLHVQSVLRKPFEIDEVEALVERFLSRRALASESQAG